MQVLKSSIRDAIITTARDKIARYGYNTTSMRSIAKASTISPGNLYRYLNNKEEILHTVIAPLITTLQNTLSHEIEDIKESRLKIIRESIESFNTIFINGFILFIEQFNSTKGDTL